VAGGCRWAGVSVRPWYPASIHPNDVTGSSRYECPVGIGLKPRLEVLAVPALYFQARTLVKLAKAQCVRAARLLE